MLVDPSDGRAHLVAAAAYYFNNQLDLFEHEARQAMALAPYDAESLATIAYMTATSGDWPRGLALAEKANALNADAAAGWCSCDALPQLLLDRRLRARTRADQARPQPRKRCTTISTPFRSRARLGARRRRAELAEDTPRSPSWTAESFVKWYKLWNIRDEDSAKLMEGIYKTGVLGG